jgi:hypothetical protein
MTDVYLLKDQPVGVPCPLGPWVQGLHSDFSARKGDYDSDRSRWRVCVVFNCAFLGIKHRFLHIFTLIPHLSRFI